MDSYLGPGTAKEWEAGLVEVPDWFDSAVKALPRRRLNDSERAAFRRDGAILLKGVFPDRRVVDEMERKVGWKKQQFFNSWWVNGIVHSVIKHSPLAELAASAMDVPEVTIWNAQVEPRGSRSERTAPWPEKPWYDTAYGHLQDISVHEDTDAYFGHLHRAGHFVKPQASFFLALTDLPRGLELLAGSHVANQRHRCRRDFGQQEFMACMDRLAEDCRGAIGWDMEPGDVVLFYGSTFHWTVFQDKPRLAISIRYVPADMMFTGQPPHPYLGTYVNWKCGPIGDCPAYPIFFSENRSRMKEQPWPLWIKKRDVDPLFMLFRYYMDRLDTRCGPIYDW